MTGWIERILLTAWKCLLFGFRIVIQGHCLVKLKLKCILYLALTLTSSITVLHGHGALFSALSMHEKEKPPYAFLGTKQ